MEQSLLLKPAAILNAIVLTLAIALFYRLTQPASLHSHLPAHLPSQLPAHVLSTTSALPSSVAEGRSMSRSVPSVRQRIIH